MAPATGFLILCLILISGCGGPEDGAAEVVVYCSLDQNYSRPILRQFEEETGIRVLARYDTEADKTVGLFHRIIEEAPRPRADVFWNSEVLRSVELGRRGLLAALDPPQASGIPAAFKSKGSWWTGFAARVRVLIYNTRLVSEEEAPRSILALRDPRWRGRAAMALPLLGTTSTHAGALWARWGEEKARAYFEALAENGVRMAPGNAAVRDLVASGEAAIGITDTDDAVEGLERGDPIRLVYPDQAAASPGGDPPLGAFFIPNTVSLIRGGPHPEEGRRLIDFLLSPRVEERLAASGSAQIPVRRGIPASPRLALPENLRVLEVDYEEAARGLEAAEPFLRRLFVR